MLKRTAENKDKRYKERLDAYYKKNFKVGVIVGVLGWHGAMACLMCLL